MEGRDLSASKEFVSFLLFMQTEIGQNTVHLHFFALSISSSYKYSSIPSTCLTCQKALFKFFLNKNT